MPPMLWAGPHKMQGALCHCMSQFFHNSRNVYALWAMITASTAGNTVYRTSIGIDLFQIGKYPRAIQFEAVIKCKHLRNIDLGRTSITAIPAGCAGYSDLIMEKVACPH